MNLLSHTISVAAFIWHEDKLLLIKNPRKGWEITDGIVG